MHCADRRRGHGRGGAAHRAGSGRPGRPAAVRRRAAAAACRAGRRPDAARVRAQRRPRRWRSPTPPTQVREERADAALTADRSATRGDDRWEVRYRDADGEVRALVVIDDRAGEVVEAWTGEPGRDQARPRLRGRGLGRRQRVVDLDPALPPLPGAVLRPAAPLRLLHLDLLVLLGFSVSLFFFNKGEIDALGRRSSTRCSPTCFVRMLIAGFTADARAASGCCRCAPVAGWWSGSSPSPSSGSATRSTEGKVIDVGVAGRDRRRPARRRRGHLRRGLLRGAARERRRARRRLRAGQLPRLRPVRAGLPVRGRVGRRPRRARRRARLRPADGAGAVRARAPAARRARRGRTLGIALAFAWLAYPFSLYTLGSSFNDSLVALAGRRCLLVVCLAAGARRARARSPA